jgi:hypothetical protein
MGAIAQHDVDRGATDGRDSSAAQADSFADERREKASDCFGRNDWW